LFIDKIKEPFIITPKKGNLLPLCYKGANPEIKITVAAFISPPLSFFSNPETWGLAKYKSYRIECI
jgi:hypothetical protein